MRIPDPSPASVYSYPRYYAIGYQWNTKAECDFLEACLSKQQGPVTCEACPGLSPGNRFAISQGRRAVAMLDIGCGAGRHLLEMARRGYRATGFDLRPEMVAFVQEEAKRAGVPVAVSIGDLRRMAPTGTYDLAVCLMDTFRFLLTNDEILRHLKKVGAHLSPEGVYVTDFWIPTKWDQIANEVYQWEQTQGKTTVRVFYLQHPESIDPVGQTFEDELVFVVDEEGQQREIRGERTRTRLILPQEFLALVEASGVFDVVGVFSDFDATKPLADGNLSWRMVSVLRKRS